MDWLVHSQCAQASKKPTASSYPSRSRMSTGESAAHCYGESGGLTISSEGRKFARPRSAVSLTRSTTEALPVVETSFHLAVQLIEQGSNFYPTILMRLVLVALIGCYR